MSEGETREILCSGVSMSDEAIRKHFMMEKELGRILTG